MNPDFPRPENPIDAWPRHVLVIGAVGIYHLRLYAKYKMNPYALTSTEDFIRLAATETVGGKPYFVIPEGEEKRSPQEWLEQRLGEKHKAGNARISR